MKRRGEQGGATVELTLVTPLLLLILLLVVALGRIALARADVDGAARDAARAASMRRDASSAAIVAKSTAASSLQAGRVSCRSNDISVDTSSFRAGGWVAVDVTCHASLADLSLLRLPATKSVHARFVSPVDTFRSAS